MTDPTSPENVSRVLNRWTVNGIGLDEVVVDVPMPTHEQMQAQLHEASVTKRYLRVYGYSKAKKEQP